MSKYWLIQKGFSVLSSNLAWIGAQTHNPLCFGHNLVNILSDLQWMLPQRLVFNMFCNGVVWTQVRHTRPKTNSKFFLNPILNLPSVISLATLCIESCEKEAYNPFLKVSTPRQSHFSGSSPFVFREGTITTISALYLRLSFLIWHVNIGIIFLCIWNSQLCLYNTQSILIGWCWKILTNNHNNFEH